MPSNPESSDRAPLIEPEEVDSPSLADANAAPSGASSSAPLDPNDEVPVPIAMSAAEIDERAQIVEALRGKPSPQLEERLKNESPDEPRLEA